MPILTVEADKSGAFATAGNATMKQLRQNQETRPAAKAPRRRVPTRSELQEELTKVVRYRAAISEVLRAIAGSPHDLQPIFQAILDSAARLCRAEAALPMRT